MLDIDSTGWSASLYNHHAAFVYSDKFTAPVLDMLAPEPGEKIIDVGCGSGELTSAIEAVLKRKEGGMVVGVDSSESMISKAKERGLEHVYVADIQELFMKLEVKFDAVFSNATLHWCKRDPRGVLRSVKRVLKPGGRFVGEMGIALKGVRGTLHRVLKARGYNPETLDPWFFPSEADYTALLTSEGLEPTHVVLFPRFTPLPTDLKGWMMTFVRGSHMRGMSDEEANSIMDEVQNILEVDCRDSQGNWAMMYTRLRFSAVLKIDT